MSDAVLLTVDEGVAVVTLNRPETLNAATPEVHAAVAEVWAKVRSDESVRAVVLTGAGKAFCAGGDLDLLQRMVEDPAERARVMTEAGHLVRELLAVEVPIVAAVNGAAVGLGCSLVALCDMVVMDEGAFLADPHVALGLVAADGGGLVFPSVMSPQQAKEAILLGSRIDAKRAFEIGIANRVAPAGESVEVALGLARSLAALPLQAVRESKRLLNLPLLQHIEANLDDALAAETRSFDEPAFQANLAGMLAKAAARREARA